MLRDERARRQRLAAALSKLDAAELKALRDLAEVGLVFESAEHARQYSARQIERDRESHEWAKSHANEYLQEQGARR